VTHSHRDYPASGAWHDGDPVGTRRFFSLPSDRAVALDVGSTLTNVTVAYETWGSLSSDASNAILLCHAWTGDSHAAGPADDGHPTPGWWEDSSARVSRSTRTVGSSSARTCSVGVRAAPGRRRHTPTTGVRGAAGSRW